MNDSAPAPRREAAEGTRDARGAGRAARRWLGGALVAVLTTAALYPTLNGAVRYEPSGVAPRDYYQPLTQASLHLDEAVWGLGARGIHVVNLALHVLNGLLIYTLALALIGAAKGVTPGKRLTLGDHVGAVIATLLFALHPLRVEAVAWIAHRAVLLSSSNSLGDTVWPDPGYPRPLLLSPYRSTQSLLRRTSRCSLRSPSISSHDRYRRAFPPFLL